MNISRETPEQTRDRLLRVIAEAEILFCEGTYAFEEFSLSDFLRDRREDALALVRDDEVWSQLVPSRDPSKELFQVFRFHFKAGLDNSGFVGWLATCLKEKLGTGVFVVCGQNSDHGGIFDYWGCPSQLGEEVRQVIASLCRSGGTEADAMIDDRARRIDLFFYGLFMDEGLLREKGINPGSRRMASVDNFRLVIGARATLVPCPGRTAHGVLFSLTHAEVDALYAEPSLSLYRPEAVSARLADGSVIPALCFNLPVPPSTDERNPQYASKLRELAGRIGLPPGYVSSIS